MLCQQSLPSLCAVKPTLRIRLQLRVCGYTELRYFSVTPNAYLYILINNFEVNYYPLVHMRSKGYSSRLVHLSFIHYVSLLGGLVSIRGA